MKLRSVEIENFRAIKYLKLSLDKSHTVFHGDNTHGKTSVLSAIAAALGAIPTLLPEVTGIKVRDADRRRSARSVRVVLYTTDGIKWAIRKGGTRRPTGGRALRDEVRNIIEADEEGRAIDLPIVAFYDTDRAVFDAPQREEVSRRNSPATPLWKERSPHAPTFEIFSSGSTRRKTRSCGVRDTTVSMSRQSWRLFALQSRR